MAAEEAAKAACEPAEQAVRAADAAREQADRARRDGVARAGRRRGGRAPRRVAHRQAPRGAAGGRVRGAPGAARGRARRRAPRRRARRARARRARAPDRAACATGSPPTARSRRTPRASPTALEAAVAGDRRRASRRSRPSSPPIAPPARTSRRACGRAPARRPRSSAGCASAATLVTAAEVRAQQARDQAADADHELALLAERLGLPAEPAAEALDEEAAATLHARIERLARRREQLGPVNPLAKDEYDEALAHVTELETQRNDLETALRELRTLIRDTDRQINETFEETFNAAARNFEELAAQLFPGGRGRLRLVKEEQGITGFAGEPLPAAGARRRRRRRRTSEVALPGEPDEMLGVEIEITPAGKSTKRLSLLSGGEKSMTALAFLFAIFLAKPCPFYILDEVEAALDDPNLTRFLALLRRYADRAQFIVVTHQKRTMEAADTLYGVSMGDDGVSKVISRHLPREAQDGVAPAAGAA